MAIYNQFRIKSIPKDRFSEERLLDIIRKNCKVISESNKKIRVKYSYEHGLSTEWDIYIEDRNNCRH